MTEPRPSTLRVWLGAIRPATLLAAVGPVLVGGACALGETQQNWLAGALALAAALTVQILVNIHNDLKDFEKGADTEDRLGEARAAQKGWLSPAQLKGALAVLVVISGVITGALAWIVCIGLCFVGLWPCSCIPFCMDSMKQVSDNRWNYARFIWSSSQGKSKELYKCYSKTIITVALIL